MRQGQLVPDGRVTQTTADNHAFTYALAMWATDSMTLGPITLTPGVRVEAIHAGFKSSLTNTSDGATYQVVIPGVGIYGAVTDALGLFAGVHKGFSPIPPEQARTGKPEASINYEAGTRYTTRYFRAEIVAFYNDYKNLTDVCEACAEGIVDKQFDAGHSTIAGGEAYIESELPLASGFLLPMRAAYTYTFTELLTSFTSGDPQFGTVHAGDELPYVPAHQASASVGLEKGVWGVNVSGTFVDAMWEHAGQGDPKPGDKTDAYFLLDGAARYKVVPHVEVYVLGRNLTNDRYIASRRPFGARPGAPLWVIGGIRGDF
jgi:Fe(3+) dicitrate transport protein